MFNLHEIPSYREVIRLVDPLIAMYEAIPINIRVKDHLVYLRVLHLLPQVGHDVAQLKGGDCPENEEDIKLLFFRELCKTIQARCRIS